MHKSQVPMMGYTFSNWEKRIELYFDCVFFSFCEVITERENLSYQTHKMGGKEKGLWEHGAFVRCETKAANF